MYIFNEQLNLNQLSISATEGKRMKPKLDFNIARYNSYSVFLLLKLLTNLGRWRPILIQISKFAVAVIFATS